MLGSSCPGGTLAEVAGEQLRFGCWLNPSPAFAQILLGGSVANRQGDLDCWRNIPITVKTPSPGAGRWSMSVMAWFQQLQVFWLGSCKRNEGYCVISVVRL
jgi:hypothetical protein